MMIEPTLWAIVCRACATSIAHGVASYRELSRMSVAMGRLSSDLTRKPE